MDIDFISKLFMVPILIICLATTHFISLLIGIEASKQKYAAIDGLRGFLAMFVFMHHSAIWLYFSHIHQWSHIPSYLFNHLGSTSVGFFFMITAFLFTNKLIQSFSGYMDWTRLYISRIMRIMPLWLTNVFILTILVGAISHFTLRESFPGLVFNISQWLLFMEPDINKVSGTRYINSGVHWSLAYEGLFYCSLAIIGSIFFRIKTTLPTIVLTVIFCSIFIIIIDKYYAIRKWERMAPFLAGSFAAFIARNEKIRKISSSHWLTPVLAALLYNVLFNYPNAFQLIPFLSIAIVFTAIACGNNFFGILTYKPTMLLGQISYSIYLLHGFILFSTFYFFIGFNLSEKLSVLNHWAIICVCTIAVIIVSAISYKYLEKPGIEISDKITQKTKLLFGKRNLKSTGQTLHQ